MYQQEIIHRNSEQKKSNGGGFDNDSRFWTSKVKILAKARIVEELDEGAENHHPPEVFSVHCKCSGCLDFRKLIVGVYVENDFFGDLWEKAKEIISSYYTLLTAPKQKNFISRKYQELLNNTCKKTWRSDGAIDIRRTSQIHCNYFSLSTEMNFIIIFNLLILRDRDQLFQLLCHQLTSLCLAYREGIKQLTRCHEGDQEYYEPEEFLSYILDGYDRLAQDSLSLSPLIIEMRDYLQKFSLTWQLVNSIFYRKFLYIPIESQMADCILRLRDAVPHEKYKNFVYRFIHFDEEMTKVGQIWDVSLNAVESYAKLSEQIARVERIELLQQITNSLRGLKNLPDCAAADEKALVTGWFESCEEVNIWIGVLNGIQRKPNYATESPCKCWSCQITSSNSDSEICAASDCATVLPNEMNNDESNSSFYHLGFAVFKHCNRSPYTKPTVSADLFCVFDDPPCEDMLCQVAINLVVGSYPLSFTKFLLKAYRPLTKSDREKFLMEPSQDLIQKLCSKAGKSAAVKIIQEAEEINQHLLLLSLVWDDVDSADPMLSTRVGVAAALAETYKIEVKFPHKRILMSYFSALFRVNEGDIVMDLDWLEKINLSNLFKGSSVQATNTEDTDSGTLGNDSNIEAIELSLNELKITADVPGASSQALELVQCSMKEVADKLSSISLNDDNSSSSTTEVLENEIKKPLVAALKLAASNKKLEEELKSLQKEHLSLQKMVKGLELIHSDKQEVTAAATKSCSTESNAPKCGHTHPHHHPSQSGSSSPSASDHDHLKESGSGADCVCYYCTLFGKNQDLISNRSTETRDRLRKRLHHLQNQKDLPSTTKNLQNIGLLLKNELPTTPPSPASTKPVNNVESMPRVNTSEAPTLPAVKMKVDLELEKRKKERKANTSAKANAVSKSNVKIQKETELNVKSLETMIEFIEGPTSKAVVEQKRVEDLAAKKQQKKTKQLELKMRRQIELNFEVLSKIDLELQDTTVQAKQIRNQISQLKSGKGKNKELKKVKVAEDKLSELEAAQVKMEVEAEKLLSDIKSMNLGVDIYQKCGEMKSLRKLLDPPLENIRQKQAPQPTVSYPIKVPSKPDEDPAKRMVTIRRINLPHAEPQVTVTAKGTTPDMDQLLYTFVSGTMVPASSLTPSAFQNGLQLFMSSNGQTKMVVDSNNQNQALQNQNHKKKMTIAAPVTKTPVPSQAPEKTKTKGAVQENGIEKPKKVGKKKKVDNEETNPTVKKKETRTGLSDKCEILEKKVKKSYIDPEFAANPFKLLDDEEEQMSESDESLPEVIAKTEEPQAKQALSQPQLNKVGKIAQKKPQCLQKDDFNATKDTKKVKKPLNPATEITSKLPMPSSQPMVSQLNTNSIMDQLNRGVRVEGLRLPPGITLTKVAASESVGVKRASINRISQPMQEYHPQAPEMMKHASNGVIMVESSPHAQKATPVIEAPPASKKKNKKKKAKMESTKTAAASQPQQTQEEMVTLKNPMFRNSADINHDILKRNMPSKVPVESHGASIIRNENGNYTIRNPSFQSSFDCDISPSGFASLPHGERPHQNNQFSAFGNEEAPTDSLPKCSIIGSEMKVLKRRQEPAQEYNPGMDTYNYDIRPTLSTYSHFGGSGVNFNNNMGTHNDENFQTFPHPNYDDLRLPEVTVLRIDKKMKTPPPIGPPHRNGSSEGVLNGNNASKPFDFNGTTKHDEYRRSSLFYS